MASLFNVDLKSSMGSLLIGMLFSAVVHGITTMQAVIYLSSYPKDRIFFKVLVVFVWILDTISLAFILHALYTYLILDFLNPLDLLHVAWTIGCEPGISSTVAFIVHQFLIYRIWVLNHELKVFAIILSILSILPYSMGLVSVVKILGGSGLWTVIPKLRWMVITAIVSTAVLDIIIASTICFQLHRSRTGFKKTEKVIQVLTVYTLGSGLMTSVVSLVVMVLYLASPNTLTYQILYLTLSKVYANALLSSLNSRQSIRQDIPAVASSSRSGQSSLKAANPFMTNVNRPPAGNAYDISLNKVGESSSSKDEDAQSMGFVETRNNFVDRVKIQHIV